MNGEQNNGSKVIKHSRLSALRAEPHRPHAPPHHTRCGRRLRTLTHTSLSHVSESMKAHVQVVVPLKQSRRQQREECNDLPHTVSYLHSYIPLVLHATPTCAMGRVPYTAMLHNGLHATSRGRVQTQCIRAGQAQTGNIIESESRMVTHMTEATAIKQHHRKRKTDGDTRDRSEGNHVSKGHSSNGRTHSSLTQPHPA